MAAASILQRIAGDAALLAAWNTVREADAQDGALSLQTRRFDYGVLTRLAEIRDELLDGSWRPDQPATFPLPGSAPPRMLTVSSLRDRVVERAFMDVAAPLLDPLLSPFAFGYRKGLGTRDAVAALREAMLSGWSHVVRTDVDAAFDSVPRVRVLNRLGAALPDDSALWIVVRLLERLDGGVDGVGIPQGSAVSPLLLNLYLDPLDRALLRDGLLPIRYADDLAVPVRGEAQGLQVVELIEEELAGLALRIGDDKTDVVAFDAGVRFLGQLVRPLGSPEGLGVHAHPRRIVIYANGPGGVLRLRGDRVRVDRDGQSVAGAPLSRVRQIVVGGRVGITTPLLQRASQLGVDVVLTNATGGYVGRFSRRRGGDVRIRQQQFRAADDSERSLALAAGFVAGKIRNMRVAALRELRRSGRALEDGGWPAAYAEELDRIAAHAAAAASTAVLMGLEGVASRRYFDWMERILAPEWEFNGRNRRPPLDPVNAMLSYGYTLLAAELVSACEIAGLDPDLGYLHSPRWGRPSLGLDLMEEWRPVLVDNTVLGLVRGGRVSPGDFQIEPGRGCRMNDKARRALLAAYEKRLLTMASSPISDGKRAYRELLAVHARSLADHLLDPGVPYQGYSWR